MKPAPSLPSSSEVAAVALRHRLWLALSFLLPLLASVAVAFVIRPQYQAVGRLLVQVGREYIPQPETTGSSQSTPSTSMKETVDTEVQIATSLDLARDVVGTVTVGRLYPSLASSRPQGAALDEAAVKEFSHDLSVSPVRLTNVIEVSLRNSDRGVAEEALSLFIDRFRALHVAAFSQSRRPVLERQVNEDTDWLTRLQRERGDYVVRNGAYSLVEQRSQVIQQRNKDVQDLRAATQRQVAVQAQLLYVDAELHRQPAMITLQTTNQPSPAADDAHKRARDVEASRRELLARGIGPNLPVMAGLDAELASLQRSLAQTKPRDEAVTLGVNPALNSLKAQQIALQVELAPLDGTIQALQRQLGTYDAQLRQLAQDDVTLRDYDRRIADLEQSTTTTRQRLADARYADDLDRAEVGSVKVVQAPTTSDRPVWPDKRLIASAGVVAGAVASAFTLLLALTFGNHCLTAETVERLLDVPVLAVLPRSKLPRSLWLAAGPLPRGQARLSSTP